jgi:hypothetical protein
MKRFILTGAPGSGKTSILRVLAAAGYAVVDEAATDVNLALLAAGDTEPWTDPMFIERIAVLQRERTEDPVSPGAAAQVHDRSAVCTLALAARRDGVGRKRRRPPRCRPYLGARIDEVPDGAPGNNRFRDAGGRGRGAGRAGA